MKEILKKFSSRKFLAAIIGAICAFYGIFFGGELSPEQANSLYAALGVIVTYIIGESTVDALAVKKNSNEK